MYVKSFGEQKGGSSEPPRTPLPTGLHSVVLVGAQSFPLLIVSGWSTSRVSILGPLDLFLVYINGDTHALDHHKSTLD